MREKALLHSPKDEEVRERAYQIYLDHGCEEGHDLENWLSAQRELEQAADAELERANTRKPVAPGR